MDSAIASIKRWRGFVTVCQALGVSRIHMLARKDRAPNCADQRKVPPQRDDIQVKQAIADVVQKRATYGYRRVCTRPRLVGHIGNNYKRMYRVMQDAGLLFRQGQKPLENRRHEGKVGVNESNTRWCLDGLELSCDNVEQVREAFPLNCCDREVMSSVAITKGINAGLG